MERKRTIIMGTAGRDFHNFNIAFRGDARYEVVCFTATQIPGIDGKSYPSELAGELGREHPNLILSEKFEPDMLGINFGQSCVDKSM